MKAVVKLDVAETAGHPPVSILLFFFRSRAPKFSLARGPLAQRLHFPVSLATRCDHVTKFYSMRYKWNCHIKLTGNVLEGCGHTLSSPFLPLAEMEIKSEDGRTVREEFGSQIISCSLTPLLTSILSYLSLDIFKCEREVNIYLAYTIVILVPVVLSQMQY